MKRYACHFRRLAITALLLTILTVVVIVAASRACRKASEGRIFTRLEAVPTNDVGLVLGTSRLLKNGKPNLHFNQRIAATTSLYHAGKVRHLLVSGDNHVVTYNEPEDMRAALVSAGIPAEAISCDYAGFRTLDSVVRAKEVFGLTSCTIISEEFHCPRAVWIARNHGLDAIAFAAPDVSLKGWSLRATIREKLARGWCSIDLYLLHRGPKFLGPKEPVILSVIAP